MSALPGFLSYSGCDATSAFVQKGNPLKLLQKHTSSTFQDIGKYPDPSKETLGSLESFTCLTYCGRLADVNLLRYAKFQEQLTLKPDQWQAVIKLQWGGCEPASTTLTMHIKRCNHQAYIWQNAHQLVSSSSSSSTRPWLGSERCWRSRNYMEGR